MKTQLLLSIFTLFVSINTLSQTPSPYAHYQLEKNADDVSENNIQGVLKNNPGFDSTDNKEGDYAIVLDASQNQYVEIYQEELQQVITTRTITAWFKTTDPNLNQIIVEEGGTDQGVAVRVNDNKIEANASHGGLEIINSISFSSTEWTHVAVVYDVDTLKLYINGELLDIDIVEGFSQIGAHADPTIIGSVNWASSFGDSPLGESGPFDGKIDDVRFYSEPLTDEDISFISGFGLTPEPQIFVDTSKYVFLPYNKLNIEAIVIDDGEIVNHDWQFITGGATLQENGTSAFVDDLTEGSHVLRYQVTDNDGDTSYKDITITVKHMEESQYSGTDPARAIIQATTNGSTITTADGKRLRGTALPVYSVNAKEETFENKIYNPNYYKNVHNMGFNAIKTFCEHPDLNDSVSLYTNLRILDSIVNLASKYQLQIMLTPGNIGYFKNHPPAVLKEKVEYFKHWLGILSQRYKNRTHVIFEQQNEPLFTNIGSYPVVSDIADFYNIMRPLAPESQISLFSYMIVFNTDFDMVALTEELETLTTIDWTKTSIAYHGYGVGSSPQVILDLNSSYPVVNTEFFPYVDNDNNNGGFPDLLYQAEGLEQIEMSWFTWSSNRDSLHGTPIEEVYKPIFNDFEEKEIMWEFTPIDFNEPIIDIGSDTTIVYPDNQIEITCSASDSDGTIVDYDWELTTTLGQADFSFENNKATVTNMTTGIYTIRVFVKDNDANVVTANKRVVVTQKHPIPGKIEAEEFYASHNLKVIEETTDDGGGYNIGGVKFDGWLDYLVNIAEKGLYGVEFRVAADDGFGGSMQLVMGDTAVGPWIFSGTTGGWQTWKTIKSYCYLPEGEHMLRYNRGDMPRGFNTNWIKFAKLNTTWSAGNDKEITLPLDSVSFTGSATDSAGIEGYSWRKIDGADVTIEGESKQTMWVKNITKDGDYYFEMTAINSFGFSFTDTVKLTVNPCTENCETNVKSNNIIDSDGFQLYPNPARNKFTIAFEGIESINKAELQIHDTSGKLIYSAVMREKNHIINSSSYPNGLYIITLVAGDKQHRKKMILLR